MIAVTDEEEIFNFHSCITQISDPDSNIIKELTSKVLATECACNEKSPQKHSGDGLEINNNNDDDKIDDKGNGTRFIKKLFGLVSPTLLKAYCNHCSISLIHLFIKYFNRSIVCHLFCLYFCD